MRDDQVDVAHLERFFKALLKCSPHFERLVLIKEMDEGHPMIMLPDCLLQFVKKMTHLVCLCLVGFQVDQGDVEVLKKRFQDEILPNRPAFGRMWALKFQKRTTKQCLESIMRPSSILSKRSVPLLGSNSIICSTAIETALYVCCHSRSAAIWSNKLR